MEESGSETKVVAAARPKIDGWKSWTKTAALTSKPGARREKKNLAQYAYHDEKGAVGRALPRATHRSYPKNEYVGKDRVLAQYPHHDDKWAVKYPVY